MKLLHLVTAVNCIRNHIIHEGRRGIAISCHVRTLVVCIVYMHCIIVSSTACFELIRCLSGRSQCFLLCIYYSHNVVDLFKIFKILFGKFVAEFS
jgi:hypothetical protein